MAASRRVTIEQSTDAPAMTEDVTVRCRGVDGARREGDMTRRFVAHRLYLALALLCGLLVGAFAWQLRAAWDWGALLFLAITGALALHYGRLALARVEVTGDRLRLRQWGAAAREVEFRQLSQVVEEGRGLRALQLHYHPRGGSGLMVTDDLRTLTLPAVQDHAGLWEALAAHVHE